MRKTLKQAKVKWQSPSNIAVVKYWGKRGFQLPLNPSLSFCLKRSVTETSVELVPGDPGSIRFLFAGQESAFASRVEQFVARLSTEITWIRKVGLLIESNNTFPHSAGIASSSSAFAALALCLADLDHTIWESEPDLLTTASQWARQGSGSACRSVFGGFSLWGKSSLLESSTNKYAVPLEAHSVFSGLKDAVLLVDSSEKQVSSSKGHELMEGHLFRKSRIAQANEHLKELYTVLHSGDCFRFLEIAEAEALSLHAMMMTSRAPYLLLKPNSLAIIQRIQQYREQTKIPVGFTIDAGANVHLLYFQENKTEVQLFIDKELAVFCEGRRWIDDEIGAGPVKLE